MEDIKLTIKNTSFYLMIITGMFLFNNQKVDTLAFLIRMWIYYVIISLIILGAYRIFGKKKDLEWKPPSK